MITLAAWISMDDNDRIYVIFEKTVIRIPDHKDQLARSRTVLVSSAPPSTDDANSS